MNVTYRGIFDLIRSAINEEAIVLPSDFDWTAMCEITKQHKIEALIYYGVFHSGIEIPDEINARLSTAVFALAGYDAQQSHEYTRLVGEFDKHGITYLPLKGLILKKYYPKPEMRYMGDADILIKTEEYPKIEKIMTALGYTFAVESNHEYIWKKQNICVELHKRLIPSYNKDYYRYFGDGWKLAGYENGKYSMSDEDLYIYLFTHLAKHYRDSGVGIKQFVDLWVFKKSMPNIDESYIDDELKKLQLSEFHQNCCRLLEVWFEKAQPDELSEFMTDYILTSGVFGRKETNELSGALKTLQSLNNKRNISFVLYMKKLFPSYLGMAQKYPFLKKTPFLLPVMWIVRIVNVLLFKRESIHKQSQSVSQLTAENIDAYEQSLKYVGLKFDFKEKEE